MLPSSFPDLTIALYCHRHWFLPQHFCSLQRACRMLQSKTKVCRTLRSSSLSVIYTGYQYITVLPTNLASCYIPASRSLAHVTEFLTFSHDDTRRKDGGSSRLVELSAFLYNCFVIQTCSLKTLSLHIYIFNFIRFTLQCTYDLCLLGKMDNFPIKVIIVVRISK